MKCKKCGHSGPVLDFEFTASEAASGLGKSKSEKKAKAARENGRKDKRRKEHE